MRFSNYPKEDFPALEDLENLNFYTYFGLNTGFYLDLQRDTLTIYEKEIVFSSTL